jgi:hypothetical protein
MQKTLFGKSSAFQLFNSRKTNFMAKNKLYEIDSLAHLLAKIQND